MNWFKRNDKLISVIAVLVSSVVSWEILCWVFEARAFILPAPSRIFAELIDTPGYFMKHAGYTLMTTMAGFALAGIVAESGADITAPAEAFATLVTTPTSKLSCVAT